MALIKICGINDATGFDAAVAAGADFIGFNFFPASPRYVTPAQAAALSARHDGGPQRIGLLVAPADHEVEAVLAAFKVDALQLYAPAERAAEVRASSGIPVWRAVGVGTAADLPRCAPGADRLLIEAKPPANATRPGGNAVTFDWSLLSGWVAPCPWLLAGGLSPGNVAAAIRATAAPAVDVSSGVERAPGVKDAALIRAFVAAARTA